MTNQERRDDQQATRISELLDILGAVILFHWDAQQVDNGTPTMEVYLPDGTIIYCQTFDALERVLRDEIGE